MITLITGGARSGKSTRAERLAAAHPGPVTYIATAQPTDDDMTQRVLRHQERRPAEWTTLEVGGELIPALSSEGLIIVECLGTWMAQFPDFVVDTEGLLTALRSRQDDTIVVTNEVGMGVHPYTEVGRHFRDALGNLNRAVADIADEVLLVVAGRVIRLEAP